MSRRLTHIVTQDEDGVRVDAVLRHALGLTGSVIRRIKWLDDGILLDGQKTFPNVLVAAGQVLDVAVDDPQRKPNILPAPGPLDVVFEDDHLVVVNKQAGILSTRWSRSRPIPWALPALALSSHRAKGYVVPPRPPPGPGHHRTAGGGQAPQRPRPH